jgi:outer membrane protein assembly factor BamB
MAAGSISRSIAYDNGTIYEGSGGPSASTPDELAAYDARTGVKLWSNPLTHGNTSTVTLSDGRAFVSSGLDGGIPEDHRLYAFDAGTGEPDWVQAFAAPSRTTLLICAVADGVVYVCGDDHTLYAVEATSGHLDWTAQIASTQSPNGGYVGGTLYITSDDSKIHAIDRSSHTDAWPAVAVQGVPSAPAIVDGRIIVGTSLGRVVSLVASTAGGVPGSAASAP